MPDTPSTVDGVRVRALLDGVQGWATTRPDLLAIALVGSWARGAARPDSDIDLVLAVHAAAGYFAFPAWLEAFGKSADRAEERHGRTRALRVWYADGPEVDFGFVGPEWCAMDPLDLRTARVARSGLVVLHDPNGVLEALAAAIGVSRT